MWQMHIQNVSFDKFLSGFIVISFSTGSFHYKNFDTWKELLQVILFEIDCAIFHKNLHELFCHFKSVQVEQTG